MHKLKLMTAVAPVLMASPALAQEITVWDVNVDEPSHATYYAGAKAAFETAHPGATLTFQSQPDAEYYTLLGTAFASKTAPDVIWANGGAQAKNLVGGLIPLDDKLPDLISKLVGKSAFTAPDEGTAMEAWHAHMLGKPVVVYTGGTPPHPWTVYVAAEVHSALEDAVAAVVR